MFLFKPVNCSHLYSKPCVRCPGLSIDCTSSPLWMGCLFDEVARISIVLLSITDVAVFELLLMSMCCSGCVNKEMNTLLITYDIITAMVKSGKLCSIFTQLTAFGGLINVREWGGTFSSLRKQALASKQQV